MIFNVSFAGTPRILTKNQKFLFDIIWEAGAFKIGDYYSLKFHQENPNFPLSPFKISLRGPENGGNLTVGQIEALGLEFCFFLFPQLGRKLPQVPLGIDSVAGIPRAGEPFARTISRIFSIPLLRFSKIISGETRRIDSFAEGKYSPGQKVLIVDDLVTFGYSAEETISACERNGINITGVLYLIDREQGGLEELRERGYNCAAIFKVSEILNYYREIGYISQAKLDEIMEYLKHNKRPLSF